MLQNGVELGVSRNGYAASGALIWSGKGSLAMSYELKMKLLMHLVCIVQWGVFASSTGRCWAKASGNIPLPVRRWQCAGCW